MWIYSSRLRFNNFNFLKQYFQSNLNYIPYLWKNEHFISGKIFFDRYLTIWTVAQWQDKRAMQAFYNKKSLTDTYDTCCEGVSCYWLNPSSNYPSWFDIAKVLKHKGYFLPLKNASEDHLHHYVNSPCSTSPMRVISLPLFLNRPRHYNFILNQEIF